MARPQRGGDGHHQRDRQAEGMGAGDHQHSGHPLQDADVEPCGDAPGDGRDGGGPQRDVKEPAGRAIRQDLRTGARLLGLLYQAHDASQGGALSRGRHTDAQAARLVDRAGDHRLTGAFGHGP